MNSVPNWFKSSHSQALGGVVEVAWLADGAVGVRDSKHSTGPTLVFTPTDWDAFTAVVQHNGLTDPRA